MDFDRKWTAFALQAEYDDFGPHRIVAAHNQRIASLEAALARVTEERDTLRALVEEVTPWLAGMATLPGTEFIDWRRQWLSRAREALVAGRPQGATETSQPARGSDA